MTPLFTFTETHFIEYPHGELNFIKYVGNDYQER